VTTCGDPNNTSCTDLGKLFLEMGSECSCWMDWGMRWGESGLNEFRRDHEIRRM